MLAPCTDRAWRVCGCAVPVRFSKQILASCIYHDWIVHGYAVPVQTFAPRWRCFCVVAHCNKLTSNCRSVGTVCNNSQREQYIIINAYIHQKQEDNTIQHRHTVVPCRDHTWSVCSCVVPVRFSKQMVAPYTDHT